ncbi:MAG TPA: twin-arginine translocase TatA/TatE family subunit [Planctomycetota bacterium]|nr:twin-arginine translocase TatA/TatE family subunit [Planctomycetota bacterium]
MPFDLSMGELLVILFVALLVFGGKLPETARKLGLALSEFKRGMREELRKVEEGVRKDEAPPPQWRPEKASEKEPEKEPEKAGADADQPAEPTRREP